MSALTQQRAVLYMLRPLPAATAALQCGLPRAENEIYTTSHTINSCRRHGRRGSRWHPLQVRGAQVAERLGLACLLACLQGVMLTNVPATAILALILALSMLTNIAATAILAPILTLSMTAGHGPAWPHHEYIASPRGKQASADEHSAAPL